MGNEAKYGQGQATEFDIDENRIGCEILTSRSRAVGPIEDVSEDFSKMNRSQDVITESENVEKLKQRLNESDAERILRREIEV